MSIILQAEKLYKEYKTSSGAVNALNGVDLSIEKGLFYAIIGRSGSGKSTLLHVLSGWTGRHPEKCLSTAWICSRSLTKKWQSFADAAWALCFSSSICWMSTPC